MGINNLIHKNNANPVLFIARNEIAALLNLTIFPLIYARREKWGL
jgi:hypothetical protein